MEKKWWIVAGAVALVAALGVGGWRYVAAQRVTAQALTGETAVVQRGTLVVTAGGTGSLAPKSEVSLALLSGGQVAEVLVEEGQVVEAGQPLIWLDTSELELQVVQAQAGLAMAEGQLAELLASPRPEEVAAQEANLEAMQGQVSAAVAERDQVTAGSSGAEVAAAEEQVAAAEMEYRAALRTYDSLDKKEDEERWDQANYDRWAAEIALDAARTQLDEVLTGADADEVRAVQANVAAAVAQRDATQAQLDLLLAGATEEEIQAAEAAVDQARVASEQAQLQLEWAMLIAPMAGTVTALDVEVGEVIGPGQPIVVLSDLSALEVDVSLDETEVVHVAVGQEARITVDAFPGVELTGEVTYIAPKADVSSGVVLYLVTTRMTPSDPSATDGTSGSGQGLPARAGMTADVEITTASREDALIVPLRAIQSEGGKSFVWRQSSDGFEQVVVTLGVMTETEVEIIAGLFEGDVVSVVASPAQGGGQMEQEFGPIQMLRGGDDD
jgi:HlyD family secretion protein